MSKGNAILLKTGSLSRAEIQRWLTEQDANALESLWSAADGVRRTVVGDAVHLRGLIEISNHCARQCGYCGLRRGHQKLTRYRMSREEVVACARKAWAMGCGTVVMQSGEDYGIKAEDLAETIRCIKEETLLAVTLSLGERSAEELAIWRDAGADRYLLRFETSDPSLFDRIHPPLPGRVSDRIAILRTLGALGYEVGSGVMVGIPGQTYESLANDIALFEEMDLDMIGVGPYIPHPATPMWQEQQALGTRDDQQVPNTEEMTCKVLALTRLNCPEANLPSTTALATIDVERGHESGLTCGANVVMPNFTPAQYRRLYEIYPAKEGMYETGDCFHTQLVERIQSMGRSLGQGQGPRIRRTNQTATR